MLEVLEGPPSRPRRTCQMARREVVKLTERLYELWQLHGRDTAWARAVGEAVDSEWQLSARAREHGDRDQFWSAHVPGETFPDLAGAGTSAFDEPQGGDPYDSDGGHRSRQLDGLAARRRAADWSADHPDFQPGVGDAVDHMSPELKRRALEGCHMQQREEARKAQLRQPPAEKYDIFDA